jgi:hypothetical protein
VKKGIIATCAIVGLFVAMEFIAPGHWSFFTTYVASTWGAIVRRWS